MSRFGFNPALHGRLHRGVAAPPIIYGATFDGTNDYQTRGAALTGAVDSKSFLFGARIRFGSVAGITRLLSQTANHIDVANSGGKIAVFGIDDTSTTVLSIRSTSAEWAADGDYHTLLINIQQSASSTHQVYLDGVPIAMDTFTDTDVAMTMDLSNWGIGADASGNGKITGDFKWLYFQDGENLDISSPANRDKFDGLDTSANGSEVTGTQPIVLHNGTYDQWHTNKGTGGGFTVTGALTEPAD